MFRKHLKLEQQQRHCDRMKYMYTTPSKIKIQMILIHNKNKTTSKAKVHTV